MPVTSIEVHALDVLKDNMAVFVLFGLVVNVVRMWTLSHV